MLQCLHKSTFRLKKEDFIVMGKIVSAVNGYISSHWFTQCGMIAWPESHMLEMWSCIRCKTTGAHKRDEQAKSAKALCGDYLWNTHRVTLRWSQRCHSEGKLANDESLDALWNLSGAKIHLLNWWVVSFGAQHCWKWALGWDNHLLQLSRGHFKMEYADWDGWHC